MGLDVSLCIKVDVGRDDLEEICLFDANITHNLGIMAEKVGIYEACWRPEDMGASVAKDIIPYLEVGLNDLKKRPEYYGWGMYYHFVPWVEKYLEACKRYPKAEIRVSR